MKQSLLRIATIAFVVLVPTYYGLDMWANIQDASQNPLGQFPPYPSHLLLLAYSNSSYLTFLLTKYPVRIFCELSFVLGGSLLAMAWVRQYGGKKVWAWPMTLVLGAILSALVVTRYARPYIVARPMIENARKERLHKFEVEAERQAHYTQLRIKSERVAQLRNIFYLLAGYGVPVENSPGANTEEALIKLKTYSREELERIQLEASYPILISAISTQKIAALQYLKSVGFSLTPAPSPSPDPLQHAAQIGNLEIVRFLVENGAVPTKGLLDASWYGHTEVVQFLLKSGADPNVKNSDGLSAYYLSRRANPDIAKMLIAYGYQRSSLISKLEEKLDGPVKDVFELKEGGMLISGDFTRYDGEPVSRLARIDHNGKLVESFTTKITELYKTAEYSFCEFAFDRGPFFLNNQDSSATLIAPCLIKEHYDGADEEFPRDVKFTFSKDGNLSYEILSTRSLESLPETDEH